VKKKSCPAVGGKIAFPLFAILFGLLSEGARAQNGAIQTDVPALKDVFANDFTIGCLLSYRHVGFPDDPYVTGQSSVIAPHGGDLIRFHMNCMSPGNNMKPQYTVDIAASASAFSAAAIGDKDSVDTHPVVRFNGDLIAQLNWAERQGFTFRGHTLVWHSQTPAEFFRSGYTAGGARLTKEKMTARMDHYLHEIFQLLHEGWPGLLSAVDVVNEAVNDNGADRTDSEWYLTFGDNGYLMKAFELARRYTTEFGETQIKLYYNDYNTANAAKADGIVRICGPIFRAGYLDGIGMQEHDGNSSPTAAQWIASYDKFDPICSEMAVTELDVTTGSANPTASVLNVQANQYAQLFKCFIERSYYSGRGKIINVSKDGLNDQYTFKTDQSSSLWDAQNQCKPAFYAVVNTGNAYHSLDSLIALADTLQASRYTAASWAAFQTALTSAQQARDKNYSASVSAADGLAAGRNALKSAMDNLVEVTDGIADLGGGVPSALALEQNYPNPFNPTTRIRFSIPRNGCVSLRVFDLQGKVVAVLVDGFRPSGDYVVAFDGTGLASGVYCYRLASDQGMETRKFNLLK
jgi:endo-1,4-beta-xylanase